MLAVPDARHALRGAARSTTPRRVAHHVPRVQPLARRGLGLRLRGPHLRRAVHLARRRRLGGRASSSGRSTTARASIVHAPGRADHRASGRVTPGRPDVRPVLGAGERGRHHRRRARGRQRVLVATATPRTGSRPTFAGRRAARRSRCFTIERADLRLPRVARSSTSSSSASRTCASRRSRTAPSSCPTCSGSCARSAAKMPGLLRRGPGRDVPAPRLDQPVLGGRRLRGRRAHGRRPGDLRLRLAPHRGHARTRSTTRSSSRSSTTRRSA